MPLDPIIADAGILGSTLTQGIETDLAGGKIPATIGPLYLGVDAESADGLTIDAGRFAFPPGHATRRYRWQDGALAPVQGGDQIGYWDLRGYNVDTTATGYFYNIASIDAVVDGSLVFAAGQPPRTRLRFFVTYDDQQARLGMELVPHGPTGAGLYIGSLDTDGTTGLTPLGGAQPRLYATSTKNEWVAISHARPATGQSYCHRFDTSGATYNDFLLAGWSGTGNARTQKFSVRGDGSVMIPGGRIRVGIEGNPAFGDPRLHVRSTANDWVMSASAEPASGISYAVRFHTRGETSASYILGGSSGDGAGTLKFSVRGNGDVHSETGYHVGGTKVVGSRRPAIADATDAASAITQLNALLAAARAHGLIAS